MRDLLDTRDPRSAPTLRCPELEYFPTSICCPRMGCANSWKLRRSPMVVPGLRDPMLDASSLWPMETYRSSCALASEPFGNWVRNTNVYY